MLRGNHNVVLMRRVEDTPLSSPREAQIVMLSVEVCG
jgi:hypothetical protein